MPAGALHHHTAAGAEGNTKQEPGHPRLSSQAAPAGTAARRQQHGQLCHTAQGL
jgi:hypothetical protein